MLRRFATARRTPSGGTAGRLARLGVAGWLLALACLAAAARASAAEPLVVYGDEDFPPYESIVEGDPVGANVDLWRAIGRVMHRDIEVRLGPWAESQDAVLRGDGQALTFLNINEERQQLYDFTQPTFTFRFPVFVRADDLSGFGTKDLSGKRIAVKRGGFPASILDQSHPEATAVPVDAITDGLRMLLRGEVDGVVESEWVGYDLLRKNGFTGIRATPEVLAIRTAHIAVPKGQAELVGELSRAVKVLADSGEFDRIADKWAGGHFVFWERQTFRRIVFAAAAAVAALLAMLGFYYVVRVKRANRLLTAEIDRRKATESELTAAQTTLRAIMDHAVDGLMTIDETGGILSFSGPAQRMFGYGEAEAIGRNIATLVPAAPGNGSEGNRDLAAAVPAAAGSVGPDGSRADRQGRRKDGSMFPVDLAAREIPHDAGVRRFVVTVRDMTEEKLAQSQRQQAQKMEAIGQLAGGIAHDFNNILSSVGGFAGFLLQDLATDSPQHRYADRIAKAAARAADLVRQILAFSRRSDLQREPSDLAAIVLETRDMLHGALPSSIEVALDIVEGEAIADVNPGQISQILLNLCVNAKDAMAGEAGRILIELAVVRPGGADYSLFRSGELPRSDRLFPADGRVFSGVLDGGRSYARIMVSDTGGGMGPDVLTRIFDPFFTTKERGRGTGLGLSVVHGIVTSYEGACIVASRPGEGSMFAVYLPLSLRRQAAAAVPVPNARGRESVLVVDDEIDVTDTLTIGLERLGYQAVGLNDPREALALFADEPGAWDVVVSDQSMPGMSGALLFRRLKALRPTLRFILCSGFSDGSTEEEALAGGMDAFLLKPVSPDALGACIRRTMDLRPPVAGQPDRVAPVA